MRPFKVPYASVSIYDIDEFLRKIVIYYTITNHQDILLGINDIKLEKDGCVFNMHITRPLTCKGLCEDEIRTYFQHLFFAMELCKNVQLKTCICVEKLRFLTSKKKGVYDPFDYNFINKWYSGIEYAYQEYNDPYGDNENSSIWQLGVCLQKLVTNSLNGVSTECLDFMSTFFKSPEERIRVEQIKVHPWFIKNLNPSAINKNENFCKIDEVYVANKIGEYKRLFFAKMHSYI